MAEKHHTIPEKIEVATAICNLYATGKHTIESCIDTQHIDVSTFYKWCAEIQEIQESYKDAVNQATNALRKELKLAAVTSLHRLVTGEQMEEEHREAVAVKDKDGKITMQPKSVKKIKKNYRPNVSAVTFALTNLDANFKGEPLPEGGEIPQTFLIAGKEVKF
jgi:hypothetical protein